MKKNHILLLLSLLLACVSLKAQSITIAFSPVSANLTAGTQTNVTINLTNEPNANYQVNLPTGMALAATSGFSTSPNIIPSSPTLYANTLTFSYTNSATTSSITFPILVGISAANVSSIITVTNPAGNTTYATLSNFTVAPPAASPDPGITQLTGPPSTNNLSYSSWQLTPPYNTFTRIFEYNTSVNYTGWFTFIDACSTGYYTIGPVSASALPSITITTATTTTTVPASNIFILPSNATIVGGQTITAFAFYATVSKSTDIKINETVTVKKCSTDANISNISSTLGWGFFPNDVSTIPYGTGAGAISEPVVVPASIESSIPSSSINATYLTTYNGTTTLPTSLYPNSNATPPSCFGPLQKVHQSVTYTNVGNTLEGVQFNFEAYQNYVVVPASSITMQTASSAAGLATAPIVPVYFGSNSSTQTPPTSYSSSNPNGNPYVNMTLGQETILGSIAYTGVYDDVNYLNPNASIPTSASIVDASASTELGTVTTGATAGCINFAAMPLISYQGSNSNPTLADGAVERLYINPVSTANVAGEFIAGSVIVISWDEYYCCPNRPNQDLIETTIGSNPNINSYYSPARISGNFNWPCSTTPQKLTINQAPSNSAYSIYSSQNIVGNISSMEGTSYGHNQFYWDGATQVITVNLSASLGTITEWDLEKSTLELDLYLQNGLSLNLWGCSSCTTSVPQGNSSFFNSGLEEMGTVNATTGLPTGGVYNPPQNVNNPQNYQYSLFLVTQNGGYINSSNPQGNIWLPASLVLSTAVTVPPTPLGTTWPLTTTTGTISEQWTITFNMSACSAAYVAAKAIPNSNITNFNQFINDFLGNAQLVFTLKAYCPVENQNAQSPFYLTNQAISSFLEELYYVPGGAVSGACTTSCKLPLGYATDAIEVTCPGCVIPGMNATSGGVYRDATTGSSTYSFGLRDDDNNGVPDANQGTGAPTDAGSPLWNTNLFTFSDHVHFPVTSTLSQGNEALVPNTQNPTSVALTGFTLADLAYSKSTFAANAINPITNANLPILLNNFYLEEDFGGVPSGGAVGAFQLTSFNVSLNGGTIYTVPLNTALPVGINVWYTTNNWATYTLIASGATPSTSTIMATGYIISINRSYFDNLSTYQLNDAITIDPIYHVTADPIANSGPVQVTINSYLSDAANCLKPVTPLPVDALHTGLNSLVKGQFYLCTSAQALGTYIKYNTSTGAGISGPGDDNVVNPTGCVQELTVTTKITPEGALYELNPFPYEYRQVGNPGSVNFTVPPGYTITNINIENTISGPYDASGDSYYQAYNWSFPFPFTENTQAVNYSIPFSAFQPLTSTQTSTTQATASFSPATFASATYPTLPSTSGYPTINFANWDDQLSITTNIDLQTNCATTNYPSTGGPIAYAYTNITQNPQVTVGSGVATTSYTIQYYTYTPTELSSALFSLYSYEAANPLPGSEPGSTYANIPPGWPGLPYNNGGPLFLFTPNTTLSAQTHTAQNSGTSSNAILVNKGIYCFEVEFTDLQPYFPPQSIMPTNETLGTNLIPNASPNMGFPVDLSAQDINNIYVGFGNPSIGNPLIGALPQGFTIIGILPGDVAATQCPTSATLPTTAIKPQFDPTDYTQSMPIFNITGTSNPYYHDGNAIDNPVISTYSPNNVCTLVAQYQCTQACTTCATCMPQTQCLSSNPIPVYMTYGWSCQPVTAWNTQTVGGKLYNGINGSSSGKGACGPEQALVCSVAVASSELTVVNGAAPFSPVLCTNFPYTFDIVSNGNGPINNFNITVTLPPGVTYAGSSTQATAALTVLNSTNQANPPAPFNLTGANSEPSLITLNTNGTTTLYWDGSPNSSTGPGISVSDNINGSSGIASGENLSVTIWLNIGCNAGANLGVINTVVSAISYCNASLTNSNPQGEGLQTQINLGNLISSSAYALSCTTNTSNTGFTVNYKSTTSALVQTVTVVLPPGVSYNTSSSSGATQTPLSTSVGIPGAGETTLVFTVNALQGSIYVPYTMATSTCGLTIPAGYVSLSLPYTETCSNPSCTATTMVDVAPVPYTLTNPYPTSTDKPTIISGINPACGSCTLAVSPPLAGITYQWYENDAAVGSGATSYIATAGTSLTNNYTAAAMTFTGCILPSSQSTALPITVYPNPNVTISSNNNQPTIISSVCSGGVSSFSPTLVANPTQCTNPVTYQWYTVTNNTTYTPIAGQTTSTYTPTAGGSYSVKVTNTTAPYCSTYAQQPITVATSIQMSGDSTVCPGNSPNLQVSIPGALNISEQWFQAGSGQISGPPSSISSGTVNYYAEIVVQTGVSSGCTLTTPNFPVTLLPTPNGYVVSADIAPSQGPVLVAPGVPVQLSATPSSGGDPITSQGWSTGDITDLTIIVKQPGTYSYCVTGQHKCTVCNTINVISPIIGATLGSCSSSGYNVMPYSNVANVTQYTLTSATNQPNWAPTTITITNTATQDFTSVPPGTYLLTSPSLTGMAITSSVSVPIAYEQNPTNQVVNGDFGNTAYNGCTTLLFNSDLACNTTHYSYAPSQSPGHFEIVNTTAGWNDPFWNNQPSNPPMLGNDGGGTTDYFMLADGAVTPNNNRVWYTTVNVIPNSLYIFAASLMNPMDNNGTAAPSQQYPEVWLQVTDNIGNVTNITAVTEFAPYSGIGSAEPWNQMAGMWTSGQATSCTLAIMLGPGGAIGRDLTIDDIIFEEIGCGSSSGAGWRKANQPCNASINIGEHQVYICPGASVLLGTPVATIPPTVTYQWYGPGGTGVNNAITTGTSPTYAASAPGSYTLTVTDGTNHCSTSDNVTVTNFTPYLSITSNKTASCLSGAISFANATSNVTINGNSITKSGTTSAWDAGACSSQLLDGASSVVATISPNSGGIFQGFIGLSYSYAGTDYTQMNYGLLFSNARATVYNQGNVASGNSSTSFAGGEVVKISVSSSGVISYSVNGTVFYTQTVTITGPLMVNTSIFTSGAAFNNISIYSSLVFRTNVFSGMGSPQYQWFVNGVIDPSTNTGVYSPSSILPGSTVYCQLYNVGCSGTTKSNTMQITNGCGGLLFSTGDQVVVPNKAAYNLSGNFTMEAWVRLPLTAENTNMPPILASRTNATVGFSLNLSGGSNGLNMDQIVLNVGPNTYFSNLFTQLDDNSCHHIAVTRNSNTLTFYLDGIAQGTQTCSTAISSTTPLYIGYDAVTGGTNSYLGYIDDVRIWNIAESSSTIIANMYAEVAGSATGLIAYWDFNEAGGQVVTDLSATANNGSLGTNPTVADPQDPLRVADVKCLTPSEESGVTFNGASAGTRVNIPNNSTYNLATGDFTMEAWVNLATSSQQTAPAIA